MQLSDCLLADLYDDKSSEEFLFLAACLLRVIKNIVTIKDVNRINNLIILVL